MLADLLQSCPILCDTMDGSLPGSSVHGIPQVRLLEWVAMPFSRGSSQPRDRPCILYVSYIGRLVLYHLHHLGSPIPLFSKSNLKINHFFGRILLWSLNVLFLKLFRNLAFVETTLSCYRHI